MLYELRIYDAMPGKPPQLHKRFADHTLGMWKKHGIQVVGMWTDEIGVTNRITYILGYRDLADREKRWAAFITDPDWVRVRAESEKDGPLLAHATNTIMRPTPYSPMQ